MVRSTEGKHPLYYEAVLQLRDVSYDAVRFVEDEIGMKRIPIAKKEKVKNGFDYYLADGDFTRALGKKLQGKFGGEFNLTSSLFGRKEGKEIYRITVLFRGIPFKKNDLVEYKGDQYNILSLGKDIMLKEVKTGKRIHLKYKDMGLVKKVD